MAIKLNEDVKKRLIKSVQLYFQENMDEEIGDLKAMLLLEFFMNKIGPAIYNQAVNDAQAVMQNNVNDLDSVCYAPENE